MKRKLEARKQTFKLAKILIFIFSVEALYVILSILYVLFIQGDQSPFERHFIKDFEAVKEDLQVVKGLLRNLMYVYIIFFLYYFYKIYKAFYQLSQAHRENYKPCLIVFIQNLKEYIILTIFIGSFLTIFGGFELFYLTILNERVLVIFLLKILGLFVGSFLTGFLFYGCSYAVVYGIPFYLLHKKIKQYYVQF